ncbi:hypothetical protein K737_300504 [Holospora undulata HU1]|uniref:Uncharacterized protein n=1 Tax=Holospora undulata HU1 TaxID=1321371 RepID=A0A061JHV8_9PROT|nr:hypothetical protein K737_300504 [Holospora undulata HU1]
MMKTEGIGSIKGKILNIILNLLSLMMLRFVKKAMKCYQTFEYMLIRDQGVRKYRSRTRHIKQL